MENCLICKESVSEFEGSANVSEFEGYARYPEDNEVASIELVKLSCNHWYCVDCLQDWFRGKCDAEKVCCYCQKKLTVDDILLFEVPAALLDLSDMGLTEIPTDLPNNLTELNIRDNEISVLENLPESLTCLFADCNQITNIDNLRELLPNLEELYISGNNINELGRVPRTLKYLYIDDIVTFIYRTPDSLIIDYHDNGRERADFLGEIAERLQGQLVDANECIEVLNAQIEMTNTRIDELTKNKIGGSFTRDIGLFIA